VIRDFYNVHALVDPLWSIQVLSISQGIYSIIGVGLQSKYTWM